MSKRAFLPWSLAALGALGAIGCERVASRRVEAITAAARAARCDGKEPLLAGDTIPAGSTIRTAAGGSADLILLPNMLLRLEENGEMEIDHLKFSADGNETSGGVRERAAVVRLRQGRILASLEQHGYNTTSLSFGTARGEFRVNDDALFAVEVQPDFSSAICLHGHVDVAPNRDKPLRIRAGESIRLDEGVHRAALAPADRASAEANCRKILAALTLDATAQMEARR